MLKKARILLFILLFSSLSLVVPFVALAQEMTATTLVDLNMRSQPNQNGSVITKLRAGTSVVVEGRNDGETWLLVHTPDGASRGWMAIQYLRFDSEVSIRSLTDMTDVDPTAPIVNEAGEVIIPAATPPVIPDERFDYPALWLGDAVLNNARAIYQRGQQQGNNPNSLIKIGESNTAGTVYMCTFHYHNYDLGAYTDLEPIVERFNSTGSFCHYDYTARTGFATANLLDDQWAVEAECQAGETPLECGNRIYNPSYALIYLGIADMGFYTEDQFRANLLTMLDYLSDNGVVPIMTTFPMADTFNDGKPQYFNAVIRDVAATENIPLMDVRSVLHEYANRGTGPDGYHLSVRDVNSTSFTGDELLFGRTMRELLTLQMLQALSF
ncbi:MAG: SH3 domain-containing protein [Chloroflexota bacterium]